MKILHVITINGFGGAEKLLLHLLPGLLRQGIDVECLILNRQQSGDAAITIREQLEQKGIRIFSGEYTGIADRRNLSFIKEIIKKGNYNLVHSHLKYTDTWLAVLKNFGKIKVPVISTLHGYNDNYEDSHGFVVNKRIYFSWYYWLTKYVWNKLDGFILISNIVAKFYHDIGMTDNKKKAIIYHGYDTSSIQFQQNRVINIEKGPSIAIPGRLLKRKGHLFAIEALEKILPDYPRAVLHFYGAGPFEATLRNNVAEKKMDSKVFFHGYVDDIINRLQQCDMVVIPSLWEGFGIVFLDAFAAQRPVVAFDLPAGNEIIKHEFNGLLAEPGSSKSLAEMILRICMSSELGIQLRENARTELSNTFSIDKMCINYKEFYKSVL